MKIRDISTRQKWWSIFCIPMLFLTSLVLCVQPSAAQESLCAEVKIEIRQEMTLERQKKFSPV